MNDHPRKLQIHQNWLIAGGLLLALLLFLPAIPKPHRIARHLPAVNHWANATSPYTNNFSPNSPGKGY